MPPNIYHTKALLVKNKQNVEMAVSENNISIDLSKSHYPHL